MRSFTALLVTALVGVAVGQQPADVAAPTAVNPTFNQNLTTTFPFFPVPYPFPYHFPAYQFPVFPGYQNPLNRFSYPQYQAYQQFYQNPLVDRFNYQQYQNPQYQAYQQYQNRLRIPYYQPQYQGAVYGAQDNDRFLPLLIPLAGDLIVDGIIGAGAGLAFDQIKNLIG